MHEDSEVLYFRKTLKMPCLQMLMLLPSMKTRAPFYELSIKALEQYKIYLYYICKPYKYKYGKYLKFYFYRTNFSAWFKIR